MTHHDDDRIQTPLELANLLAWYRKAAVDRHGIYLFCRHGLHRWAPCEHCRNDLTTERSEMDYESTPVEPDPEPDTPEDED